MTSYNTAASNSSAARKSANRLSGSSGWGDDYSSYTTGAAGVSGSASGAGDGGGNNLPLPGSPSEAGLSRKEFLWQQRWARAKSVLDRQGVTLRSWRVGIDVADVCVKLVEQAQREMKREEEREREKKKRTQNGNQGQSRR